MLEFTDFSNCLIHMFEFFSKNNWPDAPNVGAKVQRMINGYYKMKKGCKQ